MCFSKKKKKQKHQVPCFEKGKTKKEQKMAWNDAAIAGEVEIGRLNES
jgi:hypothetical protein